MDIHALTIVSALEGLRSKQFSAVELMQESLAAINKSNSTYNALLTVEDEEVALAEAAKKDTTNHAQALSGIPVILKDIFSSRGMRTTAASKVLESYVPPFDATVVEKLRQAGAIILGKANLDAWAHGSTGENSDCGPTKNAYSKDHVAGGSSSGSATAVALGMGLVATGTDTGGSIRVPASFHNLVGLKPTYGRVSRYGIVAMASSLDSIGHIAKDVRDAAYFLSLTAGQDPRDATTSAVPVPDYATGLTLKHLKGVRVGISSEYFSLGEKATKGMNHALQQQVQQALDVFKKLGATIVDVSLPHTSAALEAYYILCPSEVSSNLARYDGIRFGNDRTSFGQEAKRRIMIGTYTLSSGYYEAYYRTAQQVRTLVCQDFANAFTKADIIFAPVTPTAPPRIGEHVDDPLAMYLSDIYTVPVNLAGLAALALPAGFVDNLPVGIQIIGSQWSEERLFQIGAVYEKETQWHTYRPKI